MVRHTFLFLYTILILGTIPVNSYAADYNIKQMTPEVTVALENRRSRYDQIQDLKKQGLIGENNQGYISVLKHKVEIVDVIEAENRDRKVIYETIASQNQLGGAINKIEKVFASVQREKAQAGEKVQLENGNWVSK
ncbi:MAG: YdbL family protein [Candidatus Omnitrophota bacterium]